jgi:hypothetical protein
MGSGLRALMAGADGCMRKRSFEPSKSHENFQRLEMLDLKVNGNRGKREKHPYAVGTKKGN